MPRNPSLTRISMVSITDLDHNQGIIFPRDKIPSTCHSFGGQDRCIQQRRARTKRNNVGSSAVLPYWLTLLTRYTASNSTQRNITLTMKVFKVGYMTALPGSNCLLSEDQGLRGYISDMAQRHRDQHGFTGEGVSITRGLGWVFLGIPRVIYHLLISYVSTNENI